MLYKDLEIKEPRIMKIGSGKTNQTNAHGSRIRQMGYATRNGRALVTMLNKEGRVKIMAIGESSVNNMVKVIAHANQILKEEDKYIVGEDFAFEDVEVQSSTSETSNVKALSIVLYVEKY